MGFDYKVAGNWGVVLSCHNITGTSLHVGSVLGMVRNSSPLGQWILLIREGRPTVYLSSYVKCLHHAVMHRNHTLVSSRSVLGR